MLRLVASRCSVGTAVVATSHLARCEALERHNTESGVRRHVTPVKELEQEVIVLERQVPGEPLARVSLEDMIADLADPERRLVLFGESHDDAVAQDLECTVYDGVARRRDGRKVSLALEFVDGDRRAAAKAFSAGDTDDVRSLFRGPGDCAKYGPLARLAKTLKNDVVAANASRRHARLVAREGPGALEGVPDAEKALLPPLPYAAQPLSPGYAERLRRIGFGANKVAAQCLWDATMAYNCLASLAAGAHGVMLVCGRFHVQHFLGVVDHVEHYSERGDFPPVERDEFRVVVCLPMEANAFAHKAATDVWDDPSLDTVADFIVLTKARETAESAAAGPPAKFAGKTCPF